MTINEKRAAIARVYSSESWQQKVKKMSDYQVIAIYQKFLADGKFYEKRKFSPFKRTNAVFGKLHSNKKEEPVETKEDFEQLAMDGFIFKK